MLPGESLHSMLPWDIPWWRPDHALFFGVLYAILLVIFSGLGMVILRSIAQTIQDRLRTRSQKASLEVSFPGQDAEGNKA